MTQPTVAVVGATGQTGRAVSRALAQAGLRVIAVSRGGGVPDGASEGRSGDLAATASLAEAFAGVDAIHYIPPLFCDREEEFIGNLIEAARLAGVARLGYHSVIHPYTPDMPHHYRKARVELQIRQTDLHWTILQVAMYAQTALAFFDRANAVLSPAFDPGSRFTPVHLGDVAEATAVVHAHAGHDRATYEIAGDELIDFARMAVAIGQVLGKDVPVRPAPAAESSLRAAAAIGLDDRQAGELRHMFEHYDRQGLAGNGSVLAMLLGRRPTAFVEAMRASLVG